MDRCFFAWAAVVMDDGSNGSLMSSSFILFVVSFTYTDVCLLVMVVQGGMMMGVHITGAVAGAAGGGSPVGPLSPSLIANANIGLMQVSLLRK